jgi:hypothetical protein
MAASWADSSGFEFNRFQLLKKRESKEEEPFEEDDDDDHLGRDQEEDENGEEIIADEEKQKPRHGPSRARVQLEKWRQNSAEKQAPASHQTQRGRRARRHLAAKPHRAPRQRKFHLTKSQVNAMLTTKQPRCFIDEARRIWVQMENNELLVVARESPDFAHVSDRLVMFTVMPTNRREQEESQAAGFLPSPEGDLPSVDEKVALYDYGKTVVLGEFRDEAASMQVQVMQLPELVRRRGSATTSLLCVIIDS